MSPAHVWSVWRWQPWDQRYATGFAEGMTGIWVEIAQELSRHDATTMVDRLKARDVPAEAVRTGQLPNLPDPSNGTPAA